MAMAIPESTPAKDAWNEAELRETLIGLLAGFLNAHRTEVDPNKSFDEYGLDSIDSVIATGDIGEQLGIELPPEVLLYHRSVNAVVRALLNDQRIDVPTDTSEDKEALIFLFPGGGGRDERSLIRFRDQSAPILNFEVVGLGDWRDWIKHDLDFDKLAARACRHIEALQAEGPVRVAGYSQGGQLAYACALALERAGRSVEFVGLLDSVAQYPSQPAPKGRAFRVASRYIGAVMRGRAHVYHKDIRILLVRELWRLCGTAVQRRRLLMHVARARSLFRGAGGIRLNSWVQIIYLRNCGLLGSRKARARIHCILRFSCSDQAIPVFPTEAGRPAVLSSPWCLFPAIISRFLMQSI